MNTKFTPGPWEAGYTYNEEYAVFMGSALESRMCYSPQHVWHSKLYTSDPGDDEQHWEAEANANLIAAAPELYDALKELLEYFPVFSAPSEAEEDRSIDKALKALAKARGQHD